MLIHTTRITLLILGSMVSFSVFVIICSILLFVLTVGVFQREQFLSSRERMAWRERELIKNMRHFPFGDILFREATECAICLERFNHVVEIV